MNINHIFGTILKMSFQGSILVLLILLIRAVLRDRLPLKAYKILWTLVFLRLVVPVNIESDLSLFNIFSNFENNSAVITHNSVSTPASAVNPFSIDNTGTDAVNINQHPNFKGDEDGGLKQKVSKPAPDVRSLNMTVLTPIWCGGVVLSFILLLSTCLLTHIRIKKTEICANKAILDIYEGCIAKVKLKRYIPIYIASFTPVPFVFGILKPCLVLPSDITDRYDETELEYIMLHELKHIKRFDNISNMAYLLAVCFHWFNPLVWFAASRTAADNEAACDKAVLDLLSKTALFGYGKTIIEAARSTGKRRHIFAVHTGITGSSRDIKRRIKLIAGYGKRPLYLGLLGAILVAAVAVAGCTSARNSSEKKGDVPTTIKQVATAPDAKDTNSGGGSDEAVSRATDAVDASLKDDRAVNKGYSPLNGNAPWNVANDSFVASDGSWIYYSNADDGNKLYKISMDGSQNIKLNDEETKYINLSDGWTYYAFYNMRQPASPESGIYKVKTDGSGKTRVSSDYAMFVMVEGDWIYYKKCGDGLYGKLCRMKKDGSEKTELSDFDSWYPVISDGCIYYSGNMSKFYKMGLDGSQKTKLSSQAVRHINIVGDWIYFSSPYSRGEVYKMKKDGTEKTRVGDARTDYGLIVQDDWIYYIYNTDKHIYKMKTDGTEKTGIVSDGRVMQLNYFDGWLYYRQMDPPYHLYKVRTDGTEKTPLEGQKP